MPLGFTQRSSGRSPPESPMPWKVKHDGEIRSLAIPHGRFRLPPKQFQELGTLPRFEPEASLERVDRPGNGQWILKTERRTRFEEQGTFSEESVVHEVHFHFRVAFARQRVGPAESPRLCRVRRRPPARGRCRQLSRRSISRQPAGERVGVEEQSRSRLTHCKVTRDDNPSRNTNRRPSGPAVRA